MPKSGDDNADTQQRLREIFGDVFPETTSDERDNTPPAEESGRDEWLLDNRPPHHE